MPCMCGDTNCPSCGPVQGANPVFEQVCEWLQEEVLASLPPVIDIPWLAEEIANQFEREPSHFIEAVERRAAEWCRAYQARNK